MYAIRSYYEFGLDQEAPAVLHRLNGVDNDVEKYLLQLLFVNPDRRQVARQLLQLIDIARLGVLANEKEGLLEQFVDIHPVELGLTRLTEIKP